VRGYFGIGIEGVSKEMNIGNLFRTAHAFGASFAFTVAANYRRQIGARSDTSDSLKNMPFYAFPDANTTLLPDKCQLVGIELLDGAVDLPSFTHPSQAAYVLGPERGELSPEMQARCDFVIKIPAKFCINVGVAGAVVMYDRIRSLGRFAPRPVRPGGPTEELPAHKHGGPKHRKEAEAYLAPPPRLVPDDVIKK